jgi:hypothetical protein
MSFEKEEKKRGRGNIVNEREREEMGERGGEKLEKKRKVERRREKEKKKLS